ncbi:MAG: TetR/AcrR family transcriptional regulator [Kutzneria sp.]|nr:TetR/AcrR family transcriptional regulator [Kutzneria sp.]MBV9847889.1 TetR/AcrR family transcriptional regulator [Kutzneria sp.]
MTDIQGVRLPRAQRREQILAAATKAFAHAGYTATSLNDIAGEAGVSRMIVYRHFDSKRELYRSALDRVGDRLAEATSHPDYTEHSLNGMLAVAKEDPDGFRLLFRHAAREPEFRREADELRAGMVAAVTGRLAGKVNEPAWAEWASTFVGVAVIEAVLAWLDVGQPDPEGTAERIRAVIAGIVAAARMPPT